MFNYFMLIDLLGLLLSPGPSGCLMLRLLMSAILRMLARIAHRVIEKRVQGPTWQVRFLFLK